jgi:hypothetical protein
MTIERALRLIAGFFVLLSVGLGYYASPYWLLFTAFVGLNLLQSGFTNWCPAMWIFKKIGLRGCEVQQPAPLARQSTAGQ